MSLKLPATGIPPALIEQLERRVTQGSVEIPTLPSRSRELLALKTDDEDFDSAQLARTIESDPALSAQILRVANSVFFAPRSPIVSLQQAIGRLGSKRVREIVVMVSYKTDAFASADLPEALGPMFRRSVAASIFAQEIARLKRLPVDEAFLCGLFHNLGEPALLGELLHLARQARTKVETEDAVQVACAGGATMGAHICRAWKLSPRLAEAIEYQARPSEAPTHHDAAAFAGLSAQAARLFLANQDGPLGERLVGDPAAMVLDLYPDDLAALDRIKESLSGLLETIA